MNGGVAEVAEAAAGAADAAEAAGAEDAADAARVRASIPQPRSSRGGAPRPGSRAGGPEPITAIVSPLGAELASLRSAATERRPARAGRLRFTLARLGGETVALAATGDGARTAGERLGELLAAARPRRLLVLGVAGGLAPRLAEGALIAAERVIDEDGREAPRPDRAWLAQALRNGKLSGGTVVTTGAIQVTPEDKARLLGRALFPMHPAVADLETAAYARAAAAAGVPYLAVRVVLDPAGETLPLDFNRCRNAGGGVSAVRVLGLALRHPSSLPSLWNLRRRMRRCAQRLAEVAQGLIAEDGAAGEAR